MIRPARWILGSLVCAAVLVAVGCQDDDQRTETVDPHAGVRQRAEMPAEVVAAIDSGNVAYREDRFQDALAHYRRATELAPDDPTGWFGVYMAQTVLGDEAAAEAALERTRQIAPGATILHRTDADTAAADTVP